MLPPGRFLLIASSALLLTGCMFYETKSTRTLRHEPNFRLGYNDGCATATNEGANMRRGDLIRDDALFDTDQAYRVGWGNGHSACERLAPTNQSRGVLPDANPGVGH
jgi:hypothetical protein